MENSNNIKLFINGTPLEGETSSGISLERELIIATISPTNGHIERIPGNRTGVIDATTNSYNTEHFSVGDVISWHYGEQYKSGLVGKGIVTSISRSAGTDDVSSTNISIEITAGVTPYEVITREDFLVTQSNDNITTQAGDRITVRVPTN